MATRAMTVIRTNLVRRLHEMYTSPFGQLYYTLLALNKRLDNPGARIANDVDLFTPFLTEFLSGGIVNAESVVLAQTMTLCISLVVICNLATSWH